MITRNATAVWQGGLRDGKGTLSVGSGAFKDSPYSFRDRFEDGPAMNPEELIAAAHAGCYAMALSGQLGERGMTARRLDVTARVGMDRTEAGPTVVSSHLVLKASITGGDRSKFKEAADAAKAGCPISRLLGNLKITLEATLED
jgi:osmotically inducible protein OsmC